MRQDKLRQADLSEPAIVIVHGVCVQSDFHQHDRTWPQFAVFLPRGDEAVCLINNMLLLEFRQPVVEDRTAVIIKNARVIQCVGFDFLRRDE
jgi:hypothetical protein